MKTSITFWFALILLLSTNSLFGQSNPVANYGFEAAGTPTSWTTTNHVGTSSIVTSNMRTGARAYQNATSTTSTAGYVESNSNISVPNNSYLIIMAYYRVSGSQSSSRVQIGISGNMGSASTPAANNTYYQITRSIQNTTGSAQNWRVRLNNYCASGGSRNFIWDDVIAYVSTTATVDLTAPSSPTAVTSTYTSNSATINWTNASDNGGGSGVARTLVLRQATSTCPFTAPSFAGNTVYSSSGGYGVSSFSSWTVLDTVNVGNTTYTDNTFNSATNYVYAIAHEDFAYNHSTASLEYLPVRITTTPTPANAATGITYSPTLPTLSWAAACGADVYDVYFSNIQADVIAESVSARVSSNQAGTSYIITGSIDGTTTYYWKAVAKNTAGNAAASSTTWSFTTTTPSMGYNVARSTGITYNSIATAGLTVPWSGTYNADDQMSDAINLTTLGFTGFRYNDMAVTSFEVNTNGFITFDLSSTASYTNSFSSRKQILAPFWEDLVCQGYISSQTQAQQLSLLQNSIKYLVTGEQGNQVLTVEWSEMEIYNNPGPSINFQIKLYEQDDKIEFVYGQMYGFNGTVNYTYSYSAGLSGATVSASPTSGQAFLQQLPNVLSFSNTNTTNIAELPDCYSTIMFTPSASTSNSASGRTITNDDCSGATDLAIQYGIQNDFCQVYSSKTATASASIPACSAGSPGTPDDDVWFKFTTTSTGNYGITVNGSGSYNPVIQLFSGNCTTLTAINCVNATGNGLIETLTATALEEGTYFVRVYDANASAGGSGNFVISVYSILPPLANDDCAGATALTLGTPLSAGNTANATASSGIAACGAGSPGTPDDDVWYSFTATSDITRVTVNGGSTFNAVVQLFSGACGSLSNLTCVSSTGAAGVETIDYATTIGISYKIRIYHSASGATPTTGFVVTAQNVLPACPTLSSPSNGNTSINRASANTLSWAAVTSPSVGSKTYTVQVSTNPIFTALVSLTGNTNISATSFTIPANTLSAGTLYYWRVTCTNTNGTSSDCGYFTFSTTGTAPSCANITAPTASATLQSISSTVLSWSAGSGSPTSYDVYLSTNQANVTSLNAGARVSTSQVGTTYNASGLSNNTVYYWTIIPKNGSGSATGCYVNSFTTIPAAPANDNCAGATSISSSSSTPVSGTCLNATQSQAATVGNADDDVWYSFVASQTTHNISVAPASNYNAVVEIFSGSCGSLTSLKVINEEGMGAQENLTQAGLTIGATYYVRVYDFSSTTPSDPTFSIRINDIDMGVSAFASPSTNNCGATTVTANVYNYSATTINFATNPISVSGSVIDPSNTTTNFDAVNVTSGTLASGATLAVTLSTTYNVINAGNYRYTAVVSNSNDNNPANNSLTTTLQTISLPSPYILSGSGSYCAGGNGVSFTLSGSQVGTNYELFKSGISASEVINGTGSSLAFTNLNLTADGSYRVVATSTSTNCNSYMSASAIVTVNPLWLGITSDWNNTANWCDNVIPPTNANIIISGSAVNMPILPGNIEVNNLELTEANKSIDLGGRILTVNGAISGSGSVKGSSTSSMIINGSGNMGSLRMDQTTVGTTNALQNLTLNIGTGTVSDVLQLTNALNVVGTVTLTNGTLTTNNNLTLVSSASGTARIATIAATANITGNVTSQRYVPAVTRRYRMLSPNTASFTYNDVKDDVFITGTGGVTNGFDASTPNSASIFTYEETVAGGRGWKAVTNINHTLSSGRGAIVFVRGDRTLTNWYTLPFPAQNQVTIDFVGEVNKGNISPAITYTSTGDATADGWNLVGNPYPSQIDWSLVTKSNLNAFVYTLNPSTNGYVATSGSTVIASGQAFFVQANASNPTITFTESCKTSGAGTSYFKTSAAPLTVQMIQDSINSDIAWLDFAVGASNNYSPAEDALKFSNSSINMGFRANPNNTAIQINTVPFLANIADTFVIFANASSRSYTLEFSNFTEVPLSKSILLRDLFTNTITDLRLQSTYTFAINGNAASQGNRFELIFINNSALPVEFVAVNAIIKSKDAIVTWATASEKNNEKFIIERSFNNEVFDAVGTVKGINNTDVKQTYLFTDLQATEAAKAANSQAIYYRIKQVDFSGKYSYSNVAVVALDNNNTTTDNSIALFPNPANIYTTISSNSQLALNQVTIVDIAGKVVKQVDATSNKITINISDLNHGIYFVKTADGNVKKLIVE